MRVIVLGCGRVGSTVASQLDKLGHEVTIIDRNSDQFRRLDPDFNGTAVVGTGIDQDVLRRAGIEQSDLFIALTNGDNTNAMSAQIAKHIFGVPRAIVRIYDPVREETYKRLGIETFCPTTVGASIVLDMLANPARGTAERAGGLG